MNNITHRQHYVPQRYLSNWLNGSQFYVLDLKGKKIKKRGTNAVCFGMDYYRLIQLNDYEKALLNQIYKHVPAKLKQVIADMMALPFCNFIVESNTYEIAKQVATIFSENFEEIEESVLIQGGELLMCDIESSISERMWERIYALDETLIDNGQEKVNFFNYISSQMWRVPKKREVLLQMIEKISIVSNKDISIDSIFPYFVIFQSLVESVIMANSASYKVVYLKINDELKDEFITSDNPVINVCQEYDSNGRPKRYELFWPLNPKNAMLITTNKLLGTTYINCSEIKRYNSMIQQQAFQYLIAKNRETLE